MMQRSSLDGFIYAEAAVFGALGLTSDLFLTLSTWPYVVFPGIK